MGGGECIKFILNIKFMMSKLIYVIKIWSFIKKRRQMNSDKHCVVETNICLTEFWYVYVKIKVLYYK